MAGDDRSGRAVRSDPVPVTLTLPPLPCRLPAPDPGWSETTDVCVVGSGIAGLATALHLRRAGLHVTVVTKVNVDDGSTRWAQGGIAAALGAGDSPDQHAEDTLRAGVGLCDPAAVDVLVTEGPERIRELIRFGTGFDRDPDGALMLTREGGHRTDRVVHAGGDATGAEIQRALHAAVRRDPWIRLIEHALVVDLLQAPDGQVCGVTLHVLGEGSPDGVGAVSARAVVLATGGMGQVYRTTTNPDVSTGDGVALALRAGATVTDLEFVQFHPTALFLPDSRRAQQPLVSEALRGEGGLLTDHDGKRFMLDEHEMAELAPRDVVAKAIMRVMQADGVDHVLLDARHLGAARLASRFPTIVASCRDAGIDPATERIPVAPAAHYASGGVRTDLWGRTDVAGLYACGEVACTGVHGANRLASNSLLEGVVFARRLADDLARNLPSKVEPVTGGSTEERLPAADVRGGVQEVMGSHAGVLRSAGSLRDVARSLGDLGTEAGAPDTRTWETANLLSVATVLVAAAYARQETRGCHWREDHPHASDAWRGHLLIRLGAGGTLLTEYGELT